MKTLKRTGGFLLCLLLNMLFNLEWTLPSWVVLALCCFFGWHIKWFWISISLWFVGVLFWTLFVGWASRCSSPTPYRENKNPYSVGAKGHSTEEK